MSWHSIPCTSTDLAAQCAYYGCFGSPPFGTKAKSGDHRLEANLGSGHSLQFTPSYYSVGVYWGNSLLYKLVGVKKREGGIPAIFSLSYKVAWPSGDYHAFALLELPRWTYSSVSSPVDYYSVLLFGPIRSSR